MNKLEKISIIFKNKDLVYCANYDRRNKSLKRIEKDTDRDYYMSALEALDYGIVDKII